MRYRALAVGACNMHGVEVALGVAQVLTKGCYTLQSWLISVASNTLERRHRAVQELKSLCVIHTEYLLGDILVYQVIFSFDAVCHIVEQRQHRNESGDARYPVAIASVECGIVA